MQTFHLSEASPLTSRLSTGTPDCPVLNSALLQSAAQRSRAFHPGRDL